MGEAEGEASASCAVAGPNGASSSAAAFGMLALAAGLVGARRRRR
jgi:LPXTG-motif cell wall-anchored protein